MTLPSPLISCNELAQALSISLAARAADPKQPVGLAAAAPQAASGSSSTARTAAATLSATTPVTLPDWLLIDCRFNLGNTAAGEAAWQAGHIPGALYAHLDRELSGPKTGHNGRHPLPSPAALAATLGTWGLRPHTQVVAYDDAGGMFAARLWWLLRWVGHEAVQVLDGGLSAWLAAGGPVDTSVAARQASVFTPQVHTDWVLSADEVLAQLPSSAPGNAPGSAEGHSGLHLIDARAPDRFRGENETMDPVGGHIPGARNRFFQLNLQPDGRFKPAATLRDEFEALRGSTPWPALVQQCGSGVTACHNLLALAHAGLPATRLYAGSWSEWCADPNRPIER
jgi:thiosulfate/3-mercaptopyruvate sulfurtransferase